MNEQEYLYQSNKYIVKNHLRQNNKLSEQKIQHTFQYHCFGTGNSIEKQK